MVPDNKAVQAFAKFITAREKHRVAKEQKRSVSRPDPIISQFRFCNVRRNDDRVTKWIFEHYLDPWREEPELWFALTVARLFNNEPVLGDIRPLVLPFKAQSMRKLLHENAEQGYKNFNAAYIVSTNGRSMNKVDYVISEVLTPLWKGGKTITAFIAEQDELAQVHARLSAQNGLGSFMAAQVIADLKYANPSRWLDFDTFAASGPGSRRGLNRVMGLPVDSSWREADFRATLLRLRDSTNARLLMEPLTAHDIQNCLCEYDKYERVRLGEGRPKQLYKPLEN